jgi:hypothetical protein
VFFFYVLFFVSYLNQMFYHLSHTPIPLSYLMFFLPNSRSQVFFLLFLGTFYSFSSYV